MHSQKTSIYLKVEWSARERRKEEFDFSCSIEGICKEAREERSESMMMSQHLRLLTY